MSRLLDQALSMVVLRSRAESAISNGTPGDDLDTAETVWLVDELRLHRAELEMQNEALREALLELEVSRDRYRGLFMRLPLACILFDGEGRVIEANAVSKALAPEPGSASPGRRLSGWLAPESADAFHFHLRDVRAHGAARSVIHLRTADAGAAPFRIDSMVLASGRSQPIQFLAVLAECGAEASACGDAASPCGANPETGGPEDRVALAQLAGGMAHDFGNLLMGIIGCGERALSADQDPERTWVYVSELVAAARRGVGLTQQLTALSRDQHTWRRLIGFEGAVRASATLIERLAGDAITLEFDLGAPGAAVVADPAQIERILLNLVANARDAMPDGGTLTIRTDAVTLGSGDRANIAPGRYVRLIVRDTGVGMDAAVRARACEPFFTTKSASKGSGLGLAMVESAALALGGHLHLDSAPGSGTTCTVHLPRAAHDVAVPTGARSAAPAQVPAATDDADEHSAEDVREGA